MRIFFFKKLLEVFFIWFILNIAFPLPWLLPGFPLTTPSFPTNLLCSSNHYCLNILLGNFISSTSTTVWEAFFLFIDGTSYLSVCLGQSPCWVLLEMLAVDTDPQAMQDMLWLLRLSPAPLSLFNTRIVDNTEKEQDQAVSALVFSLGEDESKERFSNIFQNFPVLFFPLVVLGLAKRALINVLITVLQCLA